MSKDKVDSTNREAVLEAAANALAKLPHYDNSFPRSEALDRWEEEQEQDQMEFAAQLREALKDPNSVANQIFNEMLQKSASSPEAKDSE